MFLAHLAQASVLMLGGHFSKDLQLVKALEHMLGDGTIVEIQRYQWSVDREVCTITGLGYSYNSEDRCFDSGHSMPIEVALAGVSHIDLCRALDALRWEPGVSYTRDRTGIESFRAAFVNH